MIKLLIEKLYFKCFPDRKNYISPFKPVPIEITHTTVTPVKVNAICYFPKRSVQHGWIDDREIKTKLVETMKTELAKNIQIVEVQEREFDELQYWGMIEVLPNEKREYLNKVLGSVNNQDNKGGNV
ncbi:MAG: hypothetical protein IKP06_07825 [Elusimicrobiaceae bacterium]|nr:hypothetical protein [Elusimicrobiaceae bacterium]